MKGTVNDIINLVVEGKLTKQEALDKIKEFNQKAKGECSIKQIESILSEAQKALWIHNRMYADSYAYNVPCAFHIKQKVDISLLEKAINEVICNNTQLRTYFYLNGETIYQKIRDEFELKMAVYQVQHLEYHDLMECIKEDGKKSFDLEKELLVRAALYVLRDSESILLLTFHHIVIDGFSLSIIFQEIEQAYHAFCKGETYTGKQKAEYFQFVEEQNKMLTGKRGATNKNFWLDTLNGNIEPLDLEYDKVRSQAHLFEGNSVELRIDKETIDKWKVASIQSDSSLYVFMLTGFFVLLHKYTRQDTLVVGSPFMARMNEKYKETVGIFANMLPIVGTIQDEAEFQSCLNEIGQMVMDVMEHSDYPLAAVEKAVAEKKGTKQEALFQVSFHFQSWIKEMDMEETLLANPISSIHQEGEAVLAVEIFQGKEDGVVIFQYNPELFFQESVQYMLEQYVVLLNQVAENVELAIKDIDMLSEKEKTLVLETWNKTESAYPQCCIHELISQQAQKTPDRIAVQFEENTLTYKELEEKSNLLSNYISSKGIGVGDRVGVYVDPNEELLIIVLGILKAGATFVPFDMNTPKERLEYMVEDTQLKLIIANGKLPEVSSVKSIILKDTWNEIVHHPYRGASEQKATLDDIAYIIYTSGSTGKPKGAQVYHRGLTNVITSMVKFHHFNENDCIWGLTTICFDITMVEMFTPLIVGGKIEVIPQSIRKDGSKLKEKLEQTTANYIQATPATWQMLLAADWNKKIDATVITAGEALSRDLADKLLARTRAVWNQYGPTENTVYTTVKQIQKDEKVTIGFPVHNNKLYILDSCGKLCPIGVPGELYIGGDGLFKGYLNRPEINQKSMVKNTIAPEVGEYLYRTGDLCRYMPNGDIDYMGRIDNQVKLRGYRIELEEIEAVLSKEENVKSCVVVIRTDKNGHKSIVAWNLLHDPNKEKSNMEYRNFLKKWLPEYMIPTKFYSLKEYPYTLSKKIDRKLLATEEVSAIQKRYGEQEEKQVEKKVESNEKTVALALDKEEILSEVKALIADVVGIEYSEVEENTHIGEYGYDSIYFTTLSIKLSNRYQLNISPAVFYEYSTSKKITEYIWNHVETPRMEVEVEEEEKEVEFEAAKESQVDISSEKQTSERHISVIGIGGRMPHSDNLDDFFEQLLQGNDLVEELKGQRWKDNKGTRMWASLVRGEDEFDANFFHISRREAELMDPQQRLILESVWSTIEDAGYKPSELQGKRVSVFIGITGDDYMNVLKKSGSGLDVYSLSGVARTVVSNRVSFFFDFIGPSQSIDTACSSSLIAVHRGIRSLQNGECDLSIVGGVNLLLDDEGFHVIGKTGMLSPDGKCKTFDKSANGYVRGEGVATILLKPLREAQKDKDYIYAVIRGSYENHGGKTNSLTAPNVNAQYDLLVNAMEDAGVTPDTISYIETHGTGTSLGDPIEVNALKKAFQKYGELPKQEYCGLGSVKSNIGHLEAGAGIASMLKVILSLQKKVIPGNLHVREVNPYVEVTGSPFYIVSQNQKWKRLIDEHGCEIPRRAGVSSFGFGGSNAHVILEEYENPIPVIPSKEKELFVLSAKTEESLLAYAKRVQQWLIEKGKEAEDLFQHIIYTYQVGRECFAHRVAIVCSNKDELVELLGDYLKCNDSSGRIWTSTNRSEKENKQEMSVEEQEKCMRDKDYARLASYYVQTGNVKWEILRKNAKQRRIPVPTYQFQRKSYWIAYDEHQEESQEKRCNTEMDQLIEAYGDGSLDLDDLISVLEGNG